MAVLLGEVREEVWVRWGGVLWMELRRRLDFWAVTRSSELFSSSLDDSSSFDV